jgi:dienelactone hydrolase
VVRRSLITLFTVACIACGANDASTARPTTTTVTTATAAPTATPGTPVPSGTRLEDLASQFAYEAAAPLALAERGSSLDGTLTVRDIEFTSAKGGRARADIITPPSGPHPAMVFVAGSNQRREEIRADAVAVARRGVIALVLEQSQITAARPNIWTFTAQDREEAIATVVDARRAIDLLVGRTDVDPTRVGFYGFSYGAWLGAIAAAVDRRVSVVVLRSGGPQILPEIARASGRTLTTDYSRLMATVDQMIYAPAVAVPVLVQNGSRDTTYTADQMRAWQERVGGAKTLRTYDAGHTLDTTPNADALAWIAERWRLPVP